MMDQPVRNM